jgi:predicted  nucleic acid-binding Zn-ribbon protein
MANESKLNDLDPEQRNEYERLKEENGGLQGEINRSRTELEEVNSRLIQAESRLKQDTLKQRAQHLKEERASLLKRKDDLELQTNEMNLPFPEARERLLNRIKQDNAEIKQQEKDVADVRKMIETYQKNIKEIEQDLQEKKSGATSAGGEDGEAQKYEILYQKEREISEFMEKFEEDKTTYEGQINEHQTTIAALLEHWQLLPEPLMYLSGYLKQHQSEYYRRLSAIRTEGDWEGWVQFFLEAVQNAAAQSERAVVALASLVANDRRRLLAHPKANAVSYRLFELLPTMPRLSVDRVCEAVQTTFPTANSAIKLLEELGILTELTGQKKNRTFSYAAYIQLLSE